MHRKSAITLIESLIAVIIFGIGILTIMSLIIENISTVDKIKSKTTATTLAKEGLEMAYNLRDTNLLKAVVWNCSEVQNISQNPDCASRFSNGQAYKISMKLDGYYDFTTTNANRQDNVLYFHSGQVADGVNGFWYDYNNENGEKTIFSRYIYFDTLKLNGDGGSSDPTKILKIESHIPYKKGAYEEEIVLESFIGQIN